MIQATRLRRIALLGLAALLVSGCIQPGNEEVNELFRLQQAIRERSPQSRKHSGISLATPNGISLGKLPVKTGPGGRKIVSLSLDEAVRRALANNPQIAVVSFAPSISREEAIQEAAEFDVSLFGEIGYGYSRMSHSMHSSKAHEGHGVDFGWGLQQKLATGGTWQIRNSLSRDWSNDGDKRYSNALGLMFSQPLLRGAGTEVNLADLKIANLEHRISLSEFRAEVEDILTQTTIAYYDLLQAREKVAITQRLYKRTQETFKRLEARKNLDATKVQRKQAEAASKDALATLLVNRNEAADAQDTLVKLLGDAQLNLISDVQVLPATKMAVDKLTLSAKDQIIVALKNSPALEQIRLAVEQAGIGVRVAKNETLPSLDLYTAVELMGRTGSQKDSFNEVAGADNAAYQVGVQFEYPLGNRMAKSELRSARLVRRQTLAQLQATADDVVQSVREHVRRIQIAQKEIVARQDAAEAYREELKGLEDMERIRAQLTPEFLNLKLQAQRQVAASEQRLVQAIYEYNTAIVELSEVTGVMLETRRVKLAVPDAIGTDAK
ncbi:MAG: TolC family protein [Phycisphaerales bacterium]|jgi:outer membrane protein|nr:TolC family protein [Phycisphaerales bacterium]MBT7171247.1 TolC family protein [Phycisphaerales bacterium]